MHKIRTVAQAKRSMSRQPGSHRGPPVAIIRTTLYQTGAMLNQLHIVLFAFTHTHTHTYVCTRTGEHSEAFWLKMM